MASLLLRAPNRALPLNDGTLRHLTDVAVPTYDRAAITPGVVHIGVGGFHRAHQGTYFHELAERGIMDWGVIGAELRSRAIGEALEPQNHLYTVIERGPGTDHARIVGTLNGCLYAPDDPDAVLDALADERIRLVTLTVTGEGYHLDEATGDLDLDLDAAEVLADLANPLAPTTFFGFLTVALDRRRRAGVAPFTVMSCDNVPGNGRVTRTAVVSYARQVDPELAAWIDANVAFPSSMVDRITPGTSPEVTKLLQRRFGIDDQWPVVTEPFRQWVVEDTFSAGRPPLEEVGVHFTDDVGPYELMKKRLLNGSHCAMGYLGYLAGLRSTDELMADPTFHAYVAELMDREIAPLLPGVPGIDLDDYQQTLLERFSNPKIKDKLERLCRRGSTKIPSYLLPSIREALAAGEPTELLTLAVAGWLRYLRGVDFEGEAITINDARLDLLQPLAIQGGADPSLILREESIFGDLADNPEFVVQLETAMHALERDGARATVDAYLVRSLDPRMLELAA